jgi:SAM-dependent methyltransferase
VATPAERRRRVWLALAIAEYVLERPVRDVLDVGCGEALWRAPIRALHPRIRYTGVDPSSYVVRRFGASRTIRQGTLEHIDELKLRAAYDLIVCVDVLHFLSSAQLARGLASIAARLQGVAYLPAFTALDDVEGDVRTMRRRAPAWYRAQFARAGLAPVGLDCYVRRDTLRQLAALERPAVSRARPVQRR